MSWLPSRTQRPRERALFEAGFRPFFLLAALHQMLFIPAWACVGLGLVPGPAWLTPLLWHAHEMIFGFVAAAVAGFLLTAVPVWTGTPRIRSDGLRCLVALWVAGRSGFALAGVLPAWLVAALDLPFLPVLTVVLARSLFRRGQTHNQGFVWILLAGSLVNLGLHLHAAGARPLPDARELGVLAIHLVLTILVVIGGRIVPLFTANALRRRGRTDVVWTRAWLDASSVLAVAAVVGMDLATLLELDPGRSVASAVPALAAALLGLRWLGWRMDQTLDDPLVWSLHLGFAWVVLGLALNSASAWNPALPAVASVHALGAGAFGGMILAVMTRVSLGHTGRPLRAPGPMTWAYLAIALSAALRVTGALVPWFASVGLATAALSWSLAFAAFAACYARILVQPRVDTPPETWPGRIRTGG